MFSSVQHCDLRLITVEDVDVVCTVFKMSLFTLLENMKTFCCVVVEVHPYSRAFMQAA